MCRGTRELRAIAAVRPHDGATTVDAVAWDDPSWQKTVAGGSARAEFRRRRERQRERVERRKPLIIAQAVAIAIGGLVLAAGALGPSWQLAGWIIAGFSIVFALTSLFVLPNHVRAWETGADGEARTAHLLEPLATEGFVVLHDRRMPRGRENIDHIVIGPPGVFVIETKNYGGDLRVRRGELYVSGRRRTGVIDQVTRQADGVGEALGGIEVRRIIVVHRAGFPLFTSPTLFGVPIVAPGGLVRLLRRQRATLDESEVRRLTEVAVRTLPPA